MAGASDDLRKWKIATAILFVVSCGFLIAIIVLAVDDSGESKCDMSTANTPTSPTATPTVPTAAATTAKECEADFQINKTVSEESIFHDLSPEELVAVRDFMLNQTDLNLTAYKDASLLDNFIYSIENFVPDKADAIRFLDTGKDKPIRRARVIILHGAEEPPFVKEYLVSTQPYAYSVLKLKSQKDFVPYFSRPLTGPEYSGFEAIIRKIAETVYPVLYESFNGYVYHNCTDKCIQIFYQGVPGSFESGSRKIWFAAQYRVAGAILFPLPFQVMIDSASPHISKWKTKIRYNDQMFDTASDLLSSYLNGTAKKINVPVPTADDFLRASSERRGESFFDFVRHWPIPTDINGRRFSINGNIVKYGKWHTEIASRSTGAVGLFNTRFDGRQIAHEISIQEAIAYYSGYNPRSASSQYLDAGVGLGTSLHSLLPGTDCPENSVFLNVAYFFGDNDPKVVNNGVCVFELNAGIPQRRHYAYSYKKGTGQVENFFYYSGAVDNALVIRTITTPYNYDYIIDFIFHQNGVIECKTSTAGYLQTGYYIAKEDEFGFPIFNKMFGPIHDHMVLYKVDLDVDGTQNSFTTLDVKTKNVPYDEFDAPGASRVKKYFEQNERKYEQDALIRYDFDNPKVYIFKNNDKRSKLNVPRGYRIYPVYMVKQLYPDDYIATRRSAWSKYQLAVTKYDDLERFGSAMYNQHSGSDPVFDWDEMVKNNDSIVNEDLVAWVTIGGLHIPISEDIPTTFTTGNQYSFFIRPFGFFDEDPSMGSRDTTYISLKGGFSFEDYGTPSTGKCKAKGYAPF